MISITQERFTEMLQYHVSEAWKQSQQWPNHPNVQVEVKWVLSEDRKLAPDVTIHPQR